MGLAVTLYQAPAFRDFHSQIVIGSGIGQYSCQPLLQGNGFCFITQGAAARDPQTGEHGEQQEPGQTCGIYLPAAPAEQADETPQYRDFQVQGAFPGRHDVAHLLHPGVHEFLPGDDLGGLCLHLFPDPGKTAGTGLQIRHPDGVLVSHPQGQVTGGLNGQPVVPVGGVRPQDRLQPVQVLVRVADVLVIRQFRHRCPNHLMGLRRELCPDPVQQCLCVFMHRLSSRARGLLPFLLLLPFL